jgi:hypothetical protein
MIGVAVIGALGTPVEYLRSMVRSLNLEPDKHLEESWIEAEIGLLRAAGIRRRALPSQIVIKI